MQLQEFDPNFGHWLAGFIDGEGCFVIGKSKSKAGSRSYFCKLSIRVRDDDNTIIYEIQNKLQLGNVTYIPARGTSNPQIEWSVTGKEDCLSLVNILDRFSLRAKKSRDYTIWRRAVFFWNSLRFSDDGRKRFEELREELMEGRKYVAL